MWLFSLEDTWIISNKKMVAESGIGCGIKDRLRKPVTAAEWQHLNQKSKPTVNH